MKQLNQQGASTVWIMAFVVTFMALLASLGFGVWAYGERQDYKQNVQAKIKTAVDESSKIISAKKDKEFEELEKKPNRIYRGPAEYGNLVLEYPKTWNLYMDEQGSSGSLAIDGTLNPNFVPSLQSKTSTALRVQILNQQYTEAVKSIDQLVKQGKVRATPYKVPKVTNSRVGLRVDGEIILGKQGSLIIVPVRDKTLKIWTESPQFVGDFNNNILPNVNFVP